MSEESVVRSPTPAAPLPRVLSQAYGAGVRPDNANGQERRYIVSAPLVVLDTWNQSQIFDVAAVAVAPFDASLMAAMNRPWPDLVFAPAEIVPSGMTPPEQFVP